MTDLYRECHQQGNELRIGQIVNQLGDMFSPHLRGARPCVHKPLLSVLRLLCSVF